MRVRVINFGLETPPNKFEGVTPGFINIKLNNSERKDKR